MIMLGSNNYLGLTGDPRVKQAARDALEVYGTGLTGSRLLNGTTPLHLELERELAEWMGSEDVIVFTTGHQANAGCIGTILSARDTVICDSADHASILDGCLLSRAKLRPFRHNRLDKLEQMLERAARDVGGPESEGGVLVVVDGVFSMEGDVAPLPQIADLCEAHGARLMVDEAHAAGVLGARGAGSCELFGVEERVDVGLDHADAEAYELDGLLERDHAGELAGRRAEDDHVERVVCRCADLAVVPVDEPPDARLDDEPDPRPVLRAEVVEPGQVARHPPGRSRAQGAAGVAQRLCGATTGRRHGATLVAYRT